MPGMTSRMNPPSWQSAAEILGALLSHLPIASRLHEYRVWEVWESAVGETVARKARPSRVQHGKLFVMVSNSVYLQELQFSKIRIKNALNQALGAPVIKDIFFHIGRVREAVLPPAPPPSRPLPPFEEIAVPALGRPELEAALKSLLGARRRRLTKEEPRG